MNNFRYWIFVMLCLCANNCVQAQLDTMHYLPPMHARTDWGPQYLYLTTPSVVPFPVALIPSFVRSHFVACIGFFSEFEFQFSSASYLPKLIFLFPFFKKLHYCFNNYSPACCHFDYSLNSELFVFRFDFAFMCKEFVLFVRSMFILCLSLFGVLFL